MMFRCKLAFLHWMLFAPFLTTSFALAGEEEFYRLQQKLEEDVLELRSAAEEAYRNRCDVETLDRCFMGSFHGCYSSFPDPKCLSGEEFQYDVCGQPESSCGTLWDYSVSSIRFPPSFLYDAPDPEVIESMYFSQAMDEFFVTKTEIDKQYWESNYGISPPWMHFGAPSGAFRIFPARPQEDCPGDFDPRLRPWYVAGSSGPKNIILLLDNSGSMDGLRLAYLKEAALRVIDTLTIGDRIAVVPFSSSASEIQIDDKSLVKVNQDTKFQLKNAIRRFQASGATNIYEAFSRTFSLMTEAIPMELVVNCNTAILFLTDGEMTDPPELTEKDVLDFVKEGLDELEETLQQQVYLFTYSISENDDVHSFPKRLACSAAARGVWSKIIDDRSIVDSLSSYYKLFSMGLGDGNNDEFTAWVEPYTFSTNGMLGLTVSAPVFDRSLNPPVLVGVVGLDFPMSALDMALGVPIGSGATLEKVALSSTAKCPRLDLSSCQLESFRAFGIAGSDALCAANCTGEVANISVEAKACQNRGDLPARLLANRAKEGSSTTERICCPSDGGNFTEQCSSSIAAEADADQALKSSTAADDGSTGPNPLLIAVITLAGVIVLGGILLVYFRPWHRSQQRTNNPWVRRKEEENGTSHASTVYFDVHPMPPPSTNPRRYPEFASAPIDA